MVRNPVEFENDDHFYQLAMYKDMTRELNYKQRYEMVFEHSLDGIMLTKPNGDILQANHAACDILGMTEDEIIKKGRDGIVAQNKKLKKR
ncbi:MAG: PAS domain S-box protein [Balneolaceae bacterium]|nr:PAS domain S-box protein [Balneolaceae bacterium]